MSAPTPAPESVWSRGSRTLTQACAETGLSRQELTALCAEGALPWFPHTERRTKIIAWGPLVDLLERLHAEHTAGASAG
jgi:hypothetical protein